MASNIIDDDLENLQPSLKEFVTFGDQKVTHYVGIGDLITNKETIRPTTGGGNSFRKPKLHEMEECPDDTAMDTRRRRAYYAKLNREKKKVEIQNLQEENDGLRERICQLEEKQKEFETREELFKDKVKTNEAMLAVIHQIIKNHDICENQDEF